MHTEQISNLHPGWVLGGWIVAVAISSGGFLILVGLGLVGPESSHAVFLVPAVVAVGFFVGGLVVGMRWSDAPVLHGVAMTLFTVLVWFLGDVLAPRVLEPGIAAEGSGASFVLGMLLVQLVVTVAGALAGRRLVLGAARSRTAD